MDQLVSVIIPTYKRPADLKRAIKSVLEQNYIFFEVLVINDDEDDEIVMAVIKEFDDKRVKYLRNSRTKGGNGARNTGILNSKGDLIAFLDDDDEWFPNNLHYKVFNENLKNDNCGGIFSAYLVEKNAKWKSIVYEIDEIHLKDAILYNYSIGSSSNLIIKRSTFDRVGLWDEELLRQQDLELVIRILSKFRMVYENNVSVRIYGHNTPNSKKAYNEREKYLLKITKYLDKIDNNSQLLFYSSHYRRQVIYLLKQKKFKQANVLWSKSRKFQFFSMKKDGKILLLYVIEKLRTNY